MLLMIVSCWVLTLYFVMTTRKKNKSYIAIHGKATFTQLYEKIDLVWLLSLVSREFVCEDGDGVSRISRSYSFNALS